MLTKQKGVHWQNMYGACTLSALMLGENVSGWTISGEVFRDYYSWVNSFEATHPDYGAIKGDYEDKILVETEAAWQHFYQYHPPEQWSYMEI